MKRGLVVLGLLGILAATSGQAAAPMVEVVRGPDAVSYGNCMPSLAVRNGGEETVDYLQVDLAFRLRDGRERTLELKSAYRHGILRPIPPGGSTTLRVNPDESMPLGASCAEIVAVRVAESVCEAQGRPCRSTVRVDPERR